MKLFIVFVMVCLVQVNASVMPLTTFIKPVVVSAMLQNKDDSSLFGAIDSSTSHSHGVIIDKNLVVTVHHKMPANATFSVQALIASVKNSEQHTDLLLLSVPKLGGRRAQFTAHPYISQSIYMTNCTHEPCKLEVCGMIDSWDESYIYISFISHDGDSGSPIYAQDGSLIGIIKGRVEDPATKTALGSAVIPGATIKQWAGL